MKSEVKNEWEDPGVGGVGVDVCTERRPSERKGGNGPIEDE